MPSLIAALLTAMLAAAQTPPRGASVQGSVQSSTGGAVAQATVTIAGKVASTDEQGRFKIEGVAPGQGYQLTAQRPGFINGAYGARRPGGQGTPLTLAAGAALSDLTIVLTPQGVVTGRVLDPAGDPVQGVQVTLLRSMFASTSRRLNPANSASTDDRGHYRMAGVAPGSYRMMVVDRRYGSRLDSDPPPNGSGLTTYYPSAGDPLGAAPFEVFPGMERSGIDVQLRAPRTYAIRGKAVDTLTGDPMPGVDLSLIRLQAEPIRFVVRETTRTQPDGSFEFAGLESGVHAIQHLPHIGGPDITVRKDVLITRGDAEDVVLEMRPLGVITGTMRLDEGDIRLLIPPGSPSGKGIERGSQEEVIFVDAHLRALTSNWRGEEVNYRPTVELYNPDPGLGTSGLGLLQDDGTFQTWGIHASRYYFNVELLPTGYFIKSAAFNGADAMHAPLDLMQLGGGELHIVLSKKSAEVSGSLRDKDGTPLPGTQVTLWPRAPLLGLRGFGIRRTVTDQNGAFEFRGVPPGDHYAAGWEDADAGMLASPEFLDLFRSDATAVKLAENDRTRVDAKLIPSADINAELGRLP